IRPSRLTPSVSATERMELLNWRRRILELYADVRERRDGEAAWRHWRSVREEMFRTHPQSPLPAGERSRFVGLPFFDYEPRASVIADVVPTEPSHYEIQTSADGTYGFTRFAVASFELGDEPLALELYRLD